MAEESALSFDFLRHRAGLDLTPEQQTEFQRLIKLLRYGSAFQTLFVEIARPRLRDELIGRLDEVLALSGAKAERLDLSTAGLADVAALERALAEAQEKGAAIIHVVNGDAWLDEARLEALNLKREALARGLHCRLVFWLPGPVLDRIARQAADLWSWRSGVVSLLDGANGVPEMPFGDFTPRPAETGNLAEQARRVAVLRQWLNQPLDDETRLPLLDELATLLAGLGEGEAALDIRRNQEIPGYQMRGDLRSEAIAYSKIADILAARGELEAALDIRRRRVLPAFQKLGDVHSEAIAHGKIADILQTRGELEAALDIRRMHVLPVFQKLGAVREEAVAHGRIADILVAQGELEAALDIRRTREIPVYHKLGELRSEAIAHGRIADILVARGELEAALDIRQTRELPVYQKLGDVRSEAVATSKIAFVRQSQGDKDGALALLRQTLPVFQKLGEAPTVALLETRIAELE